MIRIIGRCCLFLTAGAAFVTSIAIAQTAPPSPSPGPHAAAVIAQLAAKEFPDVEAQFSDKVKAALPAGRLADAWNTLVSEGGPLKSQGTPRVQPAGDYDVVVVPCDFQRGKVDMQIAFDHAGRIAGLSFRPSVPPPAPYSLPPYATAALYAESELTVGSGEWALPGTLDMPIGTGPFPALILVHGSGPNDRDETLGPNKPFKDLATGLASRGIAVLRYDKRTRVYGAKSAAQADFTVKDEVLDDVTAAEKTLRAQPRVDPARVFVLGHSLGGMLIPRIGAADPSLAGLIVMAGLTRRLDETILEQRKYLAMADGTISDAEQAGIAEAEKTIAAVNALTPADARNSVRLSNAPASYWLDLRDYDPPSVAKTLKPPMLILQGERDYQVTMEDLGRWKAALGTKPTVTFHTYPALNHLFIPGTGKSLPSEFEVSGHVDEQVVNDIASWITRPAPAPRE